MVNAIFMNSPKIAAIKKLLHLEAGLGLCMVTKLPHMKQINLFKTLLINAIQVPPPLESNVFNKNGKKRGRKYLPRRIYVGGKTGTYAGSTVDPQTGAHTFPDGTPYKVNVHHHALIFSCGKDQFSIVALNNTGKQENLSILVGGLIKEYLPQGTFTC